MFKVLLQCGSEMMHRSGHLLIGFHPLNSNTLNSISDHLLRIFCNLICAFHNIFILFIFTICYVKCPKPRNTLVLSKNYYNYCYYQFMISRFTRHSIVSQVKREFSGFEKKCALESLLIPRNALISSDQ